MNASPKGVVIASAGMMFSLIAFNIAIYLFRINGEVSNFLFGSSLFVAIASTTLLFLTKTKKQTQIATSNYCQDNCQQSFVKCKEDVTDHCDCGNEHI